MSTLRKANLARHIEWWKTADGGFPTKPSLSFRGNELAGEVGEACNVIKKLERERLGIAGSRATRDQLADELADVLICADLIAMDLDIDLDAAVVRKFNDTSELLGLATRMSKPNIEDETMQNAMRALLLRIGREIHEGKAPMRDTWWASDFHTMLDEIARVLVHDFNPGTKGGAS